MINYHYHVSPPFGVEHLWNVFFPSIGSGQHIQVNWHIVIMSQFIHPRSLTVRPWKIVLGRLLSYWVSVTFQGRAVELREGNFYKWPKINGFQWVLFHELYVCPYWRLSSWPLVICFFGPACRKLLTKHFRYHLMEESSNSMSCMAYGYGKTQPKWP